MLVPHVVVEFAASLRRFVEPPPTIFDFVVPMRETSLSSINSGHTMREKRNKRLV